MRRMRVRTLVLFVVMLSLLIPLAVAPPASADAPPSLRIFAANSNITVERGRHDFTDLDPGIWLTPVGGNFELHATRPDYDTPVSLTQVDSETGAVLRTLPADLLQGWSGLKDFIRYRVLDVDGKVITKAISPFCPNSYSRSRLSDEGPLTSRYPYFCYGGPFTKGMVFGIDEGWATSAIGGYYYGLGWQAPRRHYTLHVWIDPLWVEQLGIAPEDAETFVAVRVVDHGVLDEGAASPTAPTSTPSPHVPIVTDPDPATMPDLVALPAWNIGIYRRKGREYMAFNATEWNAGPGKLVVEGFRGPDQDVMDAFQYFLVDDQPVGRSPAGTMEFHAGGGHDYWHFEQFTQYSLLDADLQHIVLSTKQSWCLANTDALDLLAPGANWNGYFDPLYTSCGGPGALWIREVLDVGYGDTYGQYQAGQAFDVTDVPNGTYYIRVSVNPFGELTEGATDNNLEDRLVKIKGKPDHRYVVVPPWHGIDTESDCYYCF